MSDRALVYGAGVAGLATAEALLKRGFDIVVVDDVVTSAKREAVAELGCDLTECSSDKNLAELVRGCSFVAPSPGVPETHPVISTARSAGVSLRSELDLAYDWESNRKEGPRPIVAVTGTDGKTTTVMMVESILREAGRKPIACGNTDVPFVAAIDTEADVFVVEATSFRLAFIESFRAEASAWLNLAPDHLDWHESMDTYEACKARLWSTVRDSDLAVGSSDDPIVMKHLRNLACRRITVGEAAGEYSVCDGYLSSSRGPFLEVSRLYRSLPHDITNALTAAALSIESGLAEPRSAARALEHFEGPRHRIEFVAEIEGVRYFDDSKATTPHAALTAMRGFDSIVLVAGGRNKGLDLSIMASESGRVRSVVAIGDSAEEFVRIFEGTCPVVVADSMRDAVEKSSSAAHSGDVVLLAPGCTSLDWYSGYAERGDDFRRCVWSASSGESTSSTGKAK